jgi:hypothetical protein
MLNATVTDQLRSTADAINERLPAVRAGNLGDALRFYADLKTKYELLDEQRKRIYEQIETVSRKTIPEMMEEQGIKTITLDDIGYRFTVQQRFSVSMPDKDAGMIWLRKNGLENLIQETVNAGTLTAAAKKRVEQDGLDMPPELFNMSYMAITSMTKVK